MEEKKNKIKTEWKSSKKIFLKIFQQYLIIKKIA